MSTADITWTVDGIEAAFLAEAQTPTQTRGSEVTLPLGFHGSSSIRSDIDASGVQYGTEDAIYSFNYGGPTTRTVTFRDAYDSLLKFLEWNGDELVRRGTTDRAKPWFRERLPDEAPVDSLVVPIETGDDVHDVDGFWAIIVGGEDQSRPPATYRQVDLEVFLLAPLSEYDDRDEVYDDLGDHRGD